eukprot:c15583_g1_i2 orf=213-3341(-)
MLNDECDTAVADSANTVPVDVAAKMVGKATSSEDITDLRSGSQPEKLPTVGTGIFSDFEEEGTDDEDDDRNHKHRRRVSRSRSLDRDAQESSFKKHNKPAMNGLPMYDNNYSTAESLKGLNASHMERDGPPKRHVNRDQAYGPPARLGGEGSQRGVLRGASLFRGDGLGPRFEHQSNSSRVVLGRGRGAPTEPWGVCEQRNTLDGLDFNLPLMPLGPPFNPYSGRSNSSRGNLPQSSWAGFGQFPGLTNGPLDQALSLNGVMQGTKGFPALGLTVGRSRCPDFEERGYCLRGDLCPMEHGANRIVVEDVQSLSKFNLPLALPSGRGMTLSSMSVSSSLLSPYSSNPSIAARATNLPMLDDPILSKGTLASSTFPEPDLYDPDQPLLNKEQPSALAEGFKRLPSFRKEVENNEGEAATLKRRRGQSPDEGKVDRFSTGVAMQGLTSGQSVWNRIKHINESNSTAECSTRPSSVFVDHLKAQKGVFVEDYEPQSLVGIRENHLNEKEEKTFKSSSTVGVSGISQGEAGLHFTESNNHKSRGRQNIMGLVSERAQRTLYVGCIPSSNSRKDLLKAHFQKFGEVVDIRVPSQGDRAFVQFSQREGAEAALKSPEAVMGNRFIRLSWAKRDSIPISSAADDLVKPLTTGHTMSVGFGGPQGLLTEVPVMKVKRQAAAVSVVSGSNAFKTAGKAIIQPVSSTVPIKKQEELELMKEELRRKQDELAQKRDEFRRKLERLSKQGSGVLAGLPGDQVSNLMSNDPKADMRGDQSSNKQLNLEKVDGELNNSHKEISALLASSEKALLSTDQSASGIPKDSGKTSLSSNQLPQRGLRGHSTWPGATGIGFAGPLQWSPMRYKLDNRTTAFHVLPPFPDGLLDVTALTEHFSFFGDLSNVEVEDVDKEVQGFKVTFYTRSAAEQAFLQGRGYQGTSLCFSWAKPSSSTTAGASSAGSVQVDASNDSSSQFRSEAAVELESREAKLLKNQRMFTGNGSQVDELAVVKVAGGIPESGYSEVAERGLHPLVETNPTVNSADAGSIPGLCRASSSP